jgi:plastocyanin
LGLVGGDRHGIEYRVNPFTRRDESGAEDLSGGGGMRRSNRGSLFLALLLSIVLSASACAEEEPAATAGQAEAEDAEGSVTIAGREATDHGSEDVAGRDEVEVEVDDFYFGPTVLEGDAGQTLTVTLFNEGDAPHTFTVDELDVDEELQPGDEGITAEVTFPDSGALVYYCRFHAGGGMLGGLSVGGDLSPASGLSGGSGATGGEDQPGSEKDPTGDYPGY